MFKKPVRNDAGWQNEKLPEPEDFPDASSAPGLRILDSSLRCTICKEFFSGPVSLRCGHSFCSQCIREALAAKQECPTCRKGQENEGHIRVNPVLEEAVAAWEDARASILLFIEKANKPAPSTSSPKKRKRSEPDSDSDIEIIPKSPSRASSSNAKPTTCPVCHKPASEETINQHLDNGCEAKTKNTRDAWSKLMTAKKPPKSKGKAKSTMSDTEDDSPLPKVSYDTMKDKQIKELLTHHGLPLVGDRQALIKQHQQWVILYNANLDKAAKRRKTVPELKSELARKLARHHSKTKPVVEDATAHQRKYDDEFTKLTEAARPKKRIPPHLSSPAESQSPAEAGVMLVTPVSPKPPPLPAQDDGIIIVQ